MEEIKEFAFENGKEVSWEPLYAKHKSMSDEDYSKAHRNLVILCHDVLIKYKGGYLLVTRDNLPGKGMLCVIGGRVLRGVPIIESLKRKVREECGLEISDVKPIGYARTLFKTDPFDHGKGTDTLNLMFLATGEGEIKLDNLHKEPTIVKKEDCSEEFLATLEPYTKHILEKVLEVEF